MTWQGRAATGNVLSAEDAVRQRTRLVEEGYCVVAGVLGGAFLDELRAWSDDLLARTPVPHKHRYQGSDVHVATQRRYESGNLPEGRLWSPVVDRLIDWPPAWE